MTAADFHPSLVALDIEGALVGVGNTTTPATRQAIDRVLRAGVPIVLSTGRSWPGAELIVNEFALPPGLAVLSNGAVVMHHQPLKVIARTTFDPEPAVRRALELAPDALVAVESSGGVFRVNR